MAVLVRHRVSGMTPEQYDQAAPPLIEKLKTAPGFLYHVAFVYPDKRELARAVRRVLDHGHPVSHATDHGANVAVYLADPDGNGIELYYDRPRSEWFDADGRPILRNRHFDPRELLEQVVA